MNAGESVHSVARMRALASTITLVRRQFPAAQANLSPWRDDPQTRQWSETESLDLSFHFPGWSPSLECRSLLMQLRISAERGDDQLHLLGVLMRGMTYDGERWRLASPRSVNGCRKAPTCPSSRRSNSFSRSVASCSNCLIGMLRPNQRRNPSQRTEPSCEELLLGS